MNASEQFTTRRRVIVAEDDSEMRALLEQVLTREGFQVTAVVDGLELIEVVQKLVGAGHASSSLLPDLVISDVQMPRCNGLTALAALKRMKLLAPVLLITAFGDELTHEAARRLGAAATLDKPVDLVELRKLALALVSGSDEHGS